ncbi:MAG: LEA type 2 family protein [Nitrospinae bacterium]|nr:LEA type 2 family protein [Nitrospinota bacterium]
MRKYLFPALALAATIVASCASTTKRVADNTEVKLERAHVENPMAQGFNVIKELAGAMIGAPSSTRDNDLRVDIMLYLKNKNDFALNVMKVTYTFSVEGKTVATGSREGKTGELVLDAGSEKTVSLPLKVFTRELIGHTLAGMVKKGAKLNVKGNLSFDTMFGQVTFPYSVDQTI